MLKLKTKKISSYICLATLSVSVLTSTVIQNNNKDLKTFPLIGAQVVSAKENDSVQTLTEDVTIENGVIEVPADDLYVGESMQTEGTPGLAKRTYEVRYEDSVMVSKVLISEEIITKPVDAIKYVGTKKRATVFSGTTTAKSSPTILNSSEYSSKRYIDMKASAYDLSYESCGKRPGDRGYGITASGMQARVGVVAVDPRVIPLGTRLYIEAVDGSWVYGYAVAGDTGGAIKGNRIDLFFNTRSECVQFGRRTARVYILD